MTVATNGMGLDTAYRFNSDIASQQVGLWEHLTLELSHVIPSGSVAVQLALGCFACCIAVWSWSSYVSTSAFPACARKALLATLAVTTSIELSFCCAGYLHFWMVPLVLIANAWGPLDAVLRYPIVHDIDTFFTVKQVVILCVKLVSFPFGLADLLANLRLLLGLSLVNFAMLPILYLVALPLDLHPEVQRQAAVGVIDVDLAVRLAHLASDPRRRSACLKMLRKATSSPTKSRQLPLWGTMADSRGKYRGGC